MLLTTIFQQHLIEKLYETDLQLLSVSTYLSVKLILSKRNCILRLAVRKYFCIIIVYCESVTV